MPTADAKKLLRACRRADLASVKAVHLHASDVVAYHARAMMEACAAGAVDCVVYLHQNGVGIGTWDLGFALAAARGGHAEVLRYLASAGLRIDGAAADLSAAVRKEKLRPPINQVLADEEARLWSNDRLAEEMIAAAQRRDKAAVKTLHERGAQPIRLSAKSRLDLHSMRIELQSAEPIYHPSKFWEVFNASNMLFLGWGCEENFKRTLNQNYFNYIPDNSDPKVAALDAYERECGPLPLQDYEIEDPDYDPALWWSWYDSYLLLKGDDRASRLALYKRFVARYYEKALQADRLGILKDMEEPLLGNPIRLRRRGKLISQDMANSALELNTLFGILGPSTPSTWFAELGAGYGRVAALLLARFPGRYAIFDIPPALHIAQWYLSGLFPEHSVFRFRQFHRYPEVKAELARAQIAFFTPNQLALLPDGFFDASLTISSLHEMKLEQIRHYLRLLGRKTRKALYLKQQWNYPNPHDKITISETDYPVPDGWRITLRQPDSLNPEFFERVMIVTSEPPKGRTWNWPWFSRR